MPTIIGGFTTKKQDWQLDVTQAVQDEPGAVISMPFQADTFHVTENPLGDILETNKLKGVDGETLVIEAM